jgi:hypothetical protein
LLFLRSNGFRGALTCRPRCREVRVEHQRPAAEVDLLDRAAFDLRDDGRVGVGGAPGYAGVTLEP